MRAGEAPDYEKLEGYFRALAYSTRLELLHQLRMPRAVQDIRLTARQVRAGQNPTRPASRQAIEEHLAQLLDVGVVVTQESAEARGRKEFVVNGAKLYQIMEEFRLVGAIMPGSPAGRDLTVGVPGAAPGAMEPGPKLVLVHGLLQGKAFPLRRADLAGGRGWVVGRKAGLQVSLEYDPYVSLENSEILLEGNDYVLADLRSSRNGTWLNWRRLAPEERARLGQGDVVGVGRSLFVFRRE